MQSLAQVCETDRKKPPYDTDKNSYRKSSPGPNLALRASPAAPLPVFSPSVRYNQS